MPLPILVLLACADAPRDAPRAPDSATRASAGGADSAAGSVDSGTRDRPHNVLVVLLDDVGLDKVGFAGEHPRPAPTPVIDAFAAEGLHFRNAWSHPTCSPSRAALLTGRYPRRYGLGQALGGAERWELPLDEITIPEMLAGSPWAWSNATHGKWHVATGRSPSSRDHPGAQGVGYFDGTLNNLASYDSWVRTENGVRTEETGYPTTVAVDGAIASIARLPEPWFVYVPFHAPHTPFHAPPEHLHTQDLPERAPAPALFAAMLEAVDTELGRLLAAVDPVSDHTTVFVIGDNGTTSRAVIAPADPAHAKLTLAEGGVNVPFLVRSPLVSTPGAESAALVHLVDVFPTVAALAAAPVTHPIDGLSLLPLLADPDAPHREVAYTEKFGPPGAPPYAYDQVALRDAGFKLIANLNGATLHRVDDLGAEGLPLDLDALEPAAQAAWERLTAERDRIRAEVGFAY